MNGRPTVWIMIRIDIRRIENGDSRYGNHDIFDDVETIQADTRDEVLAIAYGQRETNKKFEPSGIYDTGMMYRFLGPFEVEHNSAQCLSSGEIDTYFEDYALMNERVVNESIDRAAVVYQLLK